MARPLAPRRDRARATRPTCSCCRTSSASSRSVVLKRGLPVGEIERPAVPEWVKHTVRAAADVARATSRCRSAGGQVRVIGVVPDQIVTEALVEEPTVRDGQVVADAARDLAKIAVVERHLGTGRIGLGLVRGFGLRDGALASTIAHDAHNIVVVGDERRRPAARGRAARRARRRDRRRRAAARCARSCRSRSRACSPTGRSPRSSPRAARASRRRASSAARCPRRSSRSRSWRSR